MPTDLKPNASLKLTGFSNGAITFVPETEQEPQHFDVKFIIQALRDQVIHNDRTGARLTIQNKTRLNLVCNLSAEYSEKSYLDIELEASRQLAPFLRSLADLIECRLEDGGKTAADEK